MKSVPQKNLFIKVGGIIIDKYAIFMNVYTASGVRRRLRITFPQKDICRIQSTNSKGVFNNLGAVQILAKDFGGGMPEIYQQVSLKKEVCETSTLIKTADSSLCISIIQKPFELSIRGLKNRRICTLSAWGID